MTRSGVAKLTLCDFITRLFKVFFLAAAVEWRATTRRLRRDETQRKTRSPCIPAATQHASGKMRRRRRRKIKLKQSERDRSNDAPTSYLSLKQREASLSGVIVKRRGAFKEERRVRARPRRKSEPRSSSQRPFITHFHLSLFYVPTSRGSAHVQLWVHVLVMTEVKEDSFYYHVPAQAIHHRRLMCRG